MPAKQKPRSLKPAKEGSSGSMKEQSSRKRQPSGRISAACEACKKRKTKCSGHPPPCQMCMQLDTPCVIDLTLDMRRRTALQRTLEESRAFQDTLNAVIGVLRTGDGSEIQDLITYVKTTDDEEILEILQTKLQGKRGNDSQSWNSKIKEEDDDALSFETDEEGTDSINRTFSPTPALSRERALSQQEGGSSRPSVQALQPESAERRESQSLASRYLPLISRLRSVSDWEATRILHDFRTSPVSTEGVAALNLLDHHQSRPQLNFQTGQYPASTLGGHSSSASRIDWHPSLQVTTSEHKTPVGANSFPVWSDQSHGKLSSQPHNRSHSGHNASGSIAIASTSDPGTVRSSRISTHPAIYDAMQVHETSPVLEIFGDLRLLGDKSSRQYHVSLSEFIVRSSATIPVYLVQSRLVVEDSPLSKVFTGFRDAARQMIATGTPALEIVNGTDVVVDLFFRDRWPTDGYTCASWACELCRTLGDLDDFVRVGCVFLCARLMRWMICPTPETYADLPECQRPTPTQCFIPHMPAVDLYPIPAMRDMLCTRLQDWMTPMAQTGLSCNWPFTMEEALEIDDITGSIRISPRFGEHVSNSDNWSLNSYALSLYPELVGKVRIENG